jgi:carbamoyl-phosphate synthase large subunit
MSAPGRNDALTVLVTGAGSELAFAVIKACRCSHIPLRVVGCDADADALGLHWADVAHVVPSAAREPEAYIAALRELVEREHVRAIFPTPDVELDLLPPLRSAFATELGCWLTINPPEEMTRFHDKWLAYQWYAAHGLPTPRTARADVESERELLIAEVGFPLVLKPRRGGGSRTLFVVRDRDELERHLPLVPAPLVQERLTPDDEEYTAGTFRTRHDAVHTIVLRRTLKFGLTYKAEVVFNPRLHEACRQIIRGTQLEGVNNIQFRRTADGPRILEINPRFSGTTGIRAHFGFNEPEMVVRQYVLGEDVPPPTVRPGRVLRYVHEEYFPARARQSAVLEVAR